LTYRKIYDWNGEVSSHSFFFLARWKKRVKNLSGIGRDARKETKIKRCKKISDRRKNIDQS